MNYYRKTNNLLPFANNPRHALQFLRVCVASVHGTLDTIGIVHYEYDPDIRILNHPCVYVSLLAIDLADWSEFVGMSIFFLKKSI